MIWMNVWTQSSVRWTVKTFLQKHAKPLLWSGAVEKISQTETGMLPPPLLNKWAVEKMLVNAYKLYTVQVTVQTGCIPPLTK